ncbi:MAG TPA: AbrB/MazE/SpoVT family DNA-binding domain-containing protein [Candidatus Nanoarchaeia archaeon]|nr:AbrB/MazE/SpoVT family DNA-binding domain-containing protein [Candidatus Nanoarchaeia archaeon]
MEFVVKVRRQGENLVVTIPKKIVKELDLKDGDLIRITAKKFKSTKSN